MKFFVTFISEFCCLWKWRGEERLEVFICRQGRMAGVVRRNRDGRGNEEGRRGKGGSGSCSGCLTVFPGFEESVGGMFVEERS